MTLHLPGPDEMRIFYTTSVSSLVLEHSQRFSCVITNDPDVGDPFSAINLQLPNLTDIAADTAVDNWVTDMKAMYSNGAGHSIERAELWRYTPDTWDASFLAAYTINENGSSASATQDSGQSITTMRTAGGGLFKVTFMESVISPASTDPGTISNASLESLIADIEAGLYPWIARDGFYPVVRIAHYPGQNERLWKVRHR